MEEPAKVTLQWSVLLILLAGLFSYFYVRTDGYWSSVWYPHAFTKPSRDIAHDALVKMSAKDFIALLQETSDLMISSNAVIKGWPREQDIPYLLSVVDSQDFCGVTLSVYWSILPGRHAYQTRIGMTAVTLLGAIKDGGFKVEIIYDYPANKDEVLAWAREKQKTLGVDPSKFNLPIERFSKPPPP